MNRRTFNKLAGLSAISNLSEALTLSKPAPSTSSPNPTSAATQNPTADMSSAAEWPSRTFRRLLVDTHIPDWDDELLASFNAAYYVSTIAGAGFQSLMQYANSHVGLCLWRTNVGQMHRNMKEHDYFGEVMEECNKHKLHRVAYYSLIFDDWAYRTHPDWRIVREDGSDLTNPRVGTVCINSPYREHAHACLRELVAKYDFECIFLDMTFWPAVCYCSHCTARYWVEQRKEPPRIVDWKDTEWRTFQTSRERWMRDFALSITETIKSVRRIQVYHQGSTVFSSWSSGVSLDQFAASDFCGGDFYGGAAQYSLVCKAYLGLSHAMPFEFMTSRTTNLSDFETTKPLQQMAAESMIPMIHSSACLYIDALKPAGRLNSHVYDYFSTINAMHAPYEQFLGGEMVADVAIYYDKNSMYDPSANGLSVTEATKKRSLPHLDAVVGVARILREAHIPFSVITNATLDQLDKYRGVVLPNVLDMSPDQAEVFRRFVKNGGILYASGCSSICSSDASKQFLLGDVLGVEYHSQGDNSVAYLSTNDENMRTAIWPQENITVASSIRASAKDHATVLATIKLPYISPTEGTAINTRFAQIWSNPPAEQTTAAPGIVVNTFGTGRALWTATALESTSNSINGKLFVHLLKRILKPPFKFEADAGPSVEMTLFNQSNHQRLLVGMINIQDGGATTAASATARILLPPGCVAAKASLLPEQRSLAISRIGPYVQIQIPPFELLSMVAIDYQSR